MNKEVVIRNIKKNAFSIGCAVIALLALGAWFYPLGGMQDEQKTAAQGEADKQKTLDDLVKTQWFEPVLDPFNTTPVPLKYPWPVEAVTTAGTAAIKQLESQSLALFNAVAKLNDHSGSVLVKGLLPKLKDRDQSPIFEFPKRYLKIYSRNPDVTGRTGPGLNTDPDLANAHALNLCNDVLFAGLPPTQAEEQIARKALYDNKYKIRYRYQGDVPINKAEIDAAYLIEAATLKNSMKLGVAQNRKMYVAPDALLPNADINLTDAPSFSSIWNAQMCLWVQQDICDGLAKANADKTNILDARVKQLVSLRVPAGATSNTDSIYVIAPPGAADQQGGGGGVGGGPGDIGIKPSSVTETGKLVPSYTMSPTGRTSNGMYDVVAFTLVIDVDATQVKEVIKDLSDGKLITITNQNMHVLDMTSLRANGYVYGKGTMVRLVLDGEALYMRAWTKDLMPEDVKLRMGIPLPGAGPGGPGVGPGGPGQGFGGGGGGSRSFRQ